VFSEFHLRAPEILKNWNSEIPPRERRDRDWAGVPAFATGWGRDAGGETARETENMAAWGCESGRGRRAAREIPGDGGVGRQNFRFSVFQRVGTQKFSVSGRNQPSHSGNWLQKMLSGANVKKVNHTSDTLILSLFQSELDRVA
jgi:hypothetical protein